MTRSKTIRLVMPQWQGGDNPLYHLGAELLDNFAPSTKTPSFTVPVTYCSCYKTGHATQK